MTTDDVKQIEHIVSENQRLSQLNKFRIIVTETKLFNLMIIIIERKEK